MLGPVFGHLVGYMEVSGSKRISNQNFIIFFGTTFGSRCPYGI